MTPIREAAGLRIAGLPSSGPPIGTEADARPGIQTWSWSSKRLGAAR
jgi:hypothetical protein